MVNIYWSALEKEWARAEKPQSVIQSFLNNRQKNDNLNKCPAFIEDTKNVFYIKSLYEYSFDIKNESIVSEYYDQDFFNKHVIIRSLEEKMFSFSQSFIFFTDSDSLEMRLEFPYLEDNNITERCKVLTGSFDIGKVYRGIDFAFILKKQFFSFKIEEGEPFLYLRFNTKEKINFIQYKDTPILQSYRNDYSNSYKNSIIKKKLNDYYYFSKNKKRILEEINKNIVL